jgi:hypothetical protein
MMSVPVNIMVMYSMGMVKVVAGFASGKRVVKNWEVEISASQGIRLDIPSTTTLALMMAGVEMAGLVLAFGTPPLDKLILLTGLLVLLV